MKIIYNIFLSLIIVAFVFNSASARKNIAKVGKQDNRASAILKKSAADCAAPTESAFLNINNVKARLQNGGDMWWDLVGAPQYEVPKVTGDEVSKHSLFAGSIWVGGIDGSGQLKVAAQTYRQNGNDFWPGPLDDNGDVESLTCNNYNRFFEVRSEDVDLLRERFDEKGTSLSESDIRDINESLIEWPGKNNPFFEVATGFALPAGKSMAPFFDADGDGIYDPTRGDFPSLGLTKLEAPEEGGEPMEVQLDVVPDQIIWWIYNDKGNVHTETGGEAIGLEINATAFAFKTNDEINNMTFYKYVVDNKATTRLDSVYFAQWVDPDLGRFDDDFVGCNVDASLGIVYNGDASDDGADGYGEEIPMLGVDYFKGPLDEDGNELGMSAFIYYNNDFTAIGNPENASHYYGYMAGVWKNGNQITFGDNGTMGTEPTTYMYPSDPSASAGEDVWSECSVGNEPADRRFLQVSGPFVLEPGIINDVIVGVVWIPQASYPCPSFKPLLAADKKAQALFDNNFELLDGPDAPNLLIRELDKQLIIALYNEEGSNNENLGYDEFDPILGGQPDSTYTFQGYQVYQLRDATTSAGDLNNPGRAKLIYQVDIRDDISEVYNYSRDPATQLYMGELKVSGTNEGIQSTFLFDFDAFTNDRIINNKAYYFMAIAYAHNEFTPFELIDDGEASGQTTPYLAGRNNIDRYVGIPHLPTPQQNGLVLNAGYGESVEVTTLSGTGNGGQFLELTDETVDEILNSSEHYVENPTYKPGAGPIDVVIYDPFIIENGEYNVRMYDSDTIVGILDPESTWDVIKIQSNTIAATYPAEDEAYNFTTAQAIPYFIAPNQGSNTQQPQGFTIGASYVSGSDPASDKDNSTQEFIGATLEESDLNNSWLNLFADINGTTPLNWIRSGDSEGIERDPPEIDGVDPDPYPIFEDYEHDPDGIYENVLERRLAPYCLSSNEYPGPAFAVDNYSTTANTLFTLMSVDIIITPDQSKWTKCPVVELSNSTDLSVGGGKRHTLRKSTSKDKNGEDIEGSTGMSYFPGYAIDVEKGRRLNMMFGENSFFLGDNGGDMLWNPSSTVNRPGSGGIDGLVLGGMHYVYIMRSTYDEGEEIHSKLDGSPSDGTIGGVYKDAAWVFFPILQNGAEFLPPSEGLVPNEVVIRSRVSKPYSKYDSNPTDSLGGQEPSYQFSFADIAPVIGDQDVAEEALNQIQIVPNPYYGFSTYETGQLDNRVKIVNLPNTVNITIMSLDGTLIRKFKRDVGDNFDYSKGDLNVNTQEWDLTNSKNIKISSGMYIFHFEVPDIGERTMKWFGVLRPTDLDTF